jgi:hypothetical protein
VHHRRPRYAGIAFQRPFNKPHAVERVEAIIEGGIFVAERLEELVVQLR